MNSTQSRWSRRTAWSALSYLLAVILPVVGSWITFRVPSLRAMPFAMHFIAVAGIAAVGGIGSSVVAIVVAVVERNFLEVSSFASSPLARYNAVRVLVLAIAAVVIALQRLSRRRAQRRLEQSFGDLQERTEDLVASLASNKCACWTIDLESGKSARWFPGSYPVFGRPFEEIEKLPSLMSLLHPDDQPRLALLAELMRTSHEPLVWEYRSTWPNGELHTLEMRGSRVPGKAKVWRGVTLDITERRLTEVALMRVEKLAAMGRLASTVAHEINNPLEAVTNLLYLAGGDESLTPGTREYLRTAERELSRLANITRLTLGFVRVSGESSAVEMATVVDEVLTIFQHRLDAGKVRVERQFEAGVCVRMPPHELRQIATNLITNAADALKGEEAAIAVTSFREGGDAILLVEDNGEGIAPENLHRIFEAFFSTKTETGTGIGLWVSKELAEKNGGRMMVESVLAPGLLEGGMRTRFRLELPLAAALDHHLAS